MTLQSYAKINLTLDIIGKDPSDGYHYIDSLFQLVSLADTIEIEPVDADSDNIQFINAVVEGDTTVHKALRLFKQKFQDHKNYSIRIHKTIPMGAGLGGGSSNAAYVLRALAAINNIPLESVIPIGPKIGSDVPFFFTGGLCRVRGKGEILEPLQKIIEGVQFLIVYPNIAVSTKWAYSLIENLENQHRLNDLENYSKFNIDFLSKIVYNKFQLFVFRNHKELSKVYETLENLLDSQLSFMSGSGSSLVFGYSVEGRAKKDFEKVTQQLGLTAFLCDPLYN